MTQRSVDALTLVKLDKRFYDCLKYHESVVDMKSCITPVCVYHLTTFLTRTCKTDNMTSDERFHKNANILNSLRWSHAIRYIKYTHGPMRTKLSAVCFRALSLLGQVSRRSTADSISQPRERCVCAITASSAGLCTSVHSHNKHTQT